MMYPTEHATMKMIDIVWDAMVEVAIDAVSETAIDRSATAKVK
jgi:hypothetical protein